MTDWMTDELIAKTRDFLEGDPEGDKRARLASLLDVTEFKARQLIRSSKSFGGVNWGIFDLETTKLEGHMGRILCGSIMTWPGETMKTYKWDDYAEDPSEDGDLSVAIRDHIEKHSISCGYYSKMFDIGFLNARLLGNRHRRMKPMLHHDAIWGFGGRGGPKIGSKSMKNVAEFLGIEQKQSVPKIVWVKAGMGNKAALKILVDRCESDVRITWEAAQYNIDNDNLKAPIQMYP